MKNVKINIAVLLCSVLFFASCEKENVKPTEADPQPFKENFMNNKDGGGDDEDWIIIRGVVQSAASSIPVINAEVILFEQSLTTPIDTFYTNALGEFEFENDSGDYSFEVNTVEYQQLQSSSYTFPGSNPVTLNLQEK